MGLLVFPVLFLLVYWAFSLAMASASGSVVSAQILARLFVFSLVPIALAYHLAHFLSFLLIQGQLIIPLASDPFGYGWNLLDTAEFRPQHRHCGSKIRLDHLGHLHSGRARHCRLRSPRGGSEAAAQPGGGAPQPVSHAGPHGVLHHGKPLDPGAAHHRVYRKLRNNES